MGDGPVGGHPDELVGGHSGGRSDGRSDGHSDGPLDGHSGGLVDGRSGGHVDGNALAGDLGEIFAVDLTSATGRCSGCGHRGAVAALRVYRDAPGVVARCPECEEVVLRLVRGPDRAWLDLRGTVSLEIPLPS